MGLLFSAKFVVFALLDPTAAAADMKALSVTMILIAKGIEFAAKAIDNYVYRVDKARGA